MLDEKIMVIVDGLRPLLREFACGEYGLAVGGAHAKGMADEESDLDLYVFAGSVLSNSDRTRLTMEWSPEIRDVVAWGATAPFEQAGTDFYLRDLKIECWLRNITLIERAIGECVQGIVKREFVTWTTTGFYNHCCLSDLNNMIPVEDPQGLLKRWKDGIRNYPPKLRDTIIKRHLDAARFWPDNFHYHSAIERQDVIYTSGIVQQVVHNLIQVLFAANQVYFPGDKRLSEAISHLNHVPDCFSERIRQLFWPGVCAGVDVLRSQQRELQDLLREVENIVCEMQCSVRKIDG